MTCQELQERPPGDSPTRQFCPAKAGQYARAEDEACALIREALTTSGDIISRDGELLIRLDPLTAPRRTPGHRRLCDQLNQPQARCPGTDLILRFEIKPHPGTA